MKRAAFDVDPADMSDPIAWCPPPMVPESDSEWDYPEWDYPETDMWPDLDIYGNNEKLTLLLEEEDWEGTVRHLEDMRSHGVSPDLDSYRLGLRACRKGALGSKAHELLEDMWRRDVDPDSTCYGMAISACERADEDELAEKLAGELRQWGADPDLPERFQLVPKLSWNRPVRKMGCSVRNTLNWSGALPLPVPPASTNPVWLLPAQDETAVRVAELQEGLRAAGWQVLSCDPQVVDRLRNKAKFRRHAQTLGMAELLPVHYDAACSARYPCVLKPALGTWGRDTHIAYNSQEVESIAKEGLGTKWLLQELVPGCLEYSTALLVSRGEILDAVCTRYEYSKREYVWPNNVEEVRNDHCSVPAAHLDAMRGFLRNFSGICNFNYKLRDSGDHEKAGPSVHGSLCIFEVNPRVGGDLAFDVPRHRARAFFEKLDAMC